MKILLWQLLYGVICPNKISMIQDHEGVIFNEQ